VAGSAVLTGCGWHPFTPTPPEVPAVGVLSGFSQSEAHEITDPFRQGLTELGYVEGRNIALELRFTDGQDERLPSLAGELVARPVRVIFASDTPAALAAKAATGAIPIVMAGGDPVALGLADSLARPGGHVTGLSYASMLLAGKRLELLKQVAPATRRVVALWYAPNAVGAVNLREAQEASPRLGIDLRPVGIRGPDDLDAAFHAVAAQQPDALFVISGGLNTRRARILEFAAGTGLPAVFQRREWVEGGGLMSYAVDFQDVYRRAASFVDKILKGARPADLPIERPTEFELVINLRTARALGLTIPPSVLQQATEVIQ
jgi:putative ABC transport system substrate-binding protein